MNPIDIAVGVVVVALIVAIIYRIVKKGSCDCGCSGSGDCCHSSCPSHKSK